MDWWCNRDPLPHWRENTALPSEHQVLSALFNHQDIYKSYPKIYVVSALIGNVRNKQFVPTIRWYASPSIPCKAKTIQKLGWVLTGAYERCEAALISSWRWPLRILNLSHLMPVCPIILCSHQPIKIVGTLNNSRAPWLDEHSKALPPLQQRTEATVGYQELEQIFS